MHRHSASIQLDAGALLVRKLGLRSPLTTQERAALASLVTGEVQIRTRDQLVHEGATLHRSLLVVEGYAACYKLTVSGERQIVSLHVAGDLIDLHTAVLSIADHGLMACGPARIAYLPHEAILAASLRHAGVAWALWRDSLADAAIAREWLLNIGQRDAYARTAHLLCELGLRLEAIGQASRHRFVLPLSQHELGDVTSITSVHVNRTLQKLRADGLIATHGSEVCVRDWSALASAGGFDPSYLYLPN